jgi:hypothetical protein
MINLFLYISLSIIGVGSIAYTIYKKRDLYKVSTLLVFCLFTGSVTWLGEFLVLGLFNSYAYKTGVFTDPWAQNLIGHLLINTTLYPAAAIIMVGYSLCYKWIFSVAAVFTLLEYWFVNLRIYEQHWWRYYMTFIAVVLFLSFFKKWFAIMNQKRYGISRATTFYFVAMIIIHIPAPVLLLLGKQYYKVDLVNHLVGNLYLSSIIIIFFYHMIESLLLVIVTCVLKKWYWKVVPVIISIAVQTIFVKMNILVMQGDWKLIYSLILYELFIITYIFVEKYTLKPESHVFR